MEPRKRIALIFNPIAGRGRNQADALNWQHRLTKHGFEVELEESNRVRDGASGLLKRADAVLILGGDGTVMGLLEALAFSAKPVYALPRGNESLFSRHFSMSDDFEHVVEVLGRGKASPHHFGRVGNRTFFTMVSLGLDSEVIESLHQDRRGRLRRVDYFISALRAAICFSMPHITLVVDGKEVLRQEPGYLIIANTCEYAGGINPIPEADSSSGLLCARFYPHHGLLGYLKWGLHYALKHPIDIEGSLLFRGYEFEVDTGDRLNFPLQADGDAAGHTPARVYVDKHKIYVL